MVSGSARDGDAENSGSAHASTRVRRAIIWDPPCSLVNGQLAALLMFGALLVTAVNGMVSIDRKRRRALGALWDDFEAQTSRLPFAAILIGRTRFELAEFHIWQVALAVALFSGVLWVHGIIGPSPLLALRA
jgi:uncharacterized membrane protein